LDIKFTHVFQQDQTPTVFNDGLLLTNQLLNGCGITVSRSPGCSWLCRQPIGC